MPHTPAALGTGSPFALALSKALAAAGWAYRQGKLSWTHEAAGLTLSLEAGFRVKIAVTDDPEERPERLTTAKRSPSDAAADVARQVADCVTEVLKITEEANT